MEQQPPARSAGAVVVNRQTGEPRYLLLRAYRNWDFPKGLLEPGEAPLDAALREVREETGLDDLTFRWGYEFRETEPYNRGKVARFYLAETGQTDIVLPVSPELGRPEHDEYRWVNLDAARRLLPPRLVRILEWAHERVANAAP